MSQPERPKRGGLNKVMAQLVEGTSLVYANGVKALASTVSKLDLKTPWQGDAKKFSDLKAAVAERLAAIEKLNKDLVNALEWESDAEAEIADCKTALQRKLTIAELKKDMDQVKAFLQECFTRPDPIFRASILLTCIRYYLSGDFESLEDGHQSVHELKRRGILMPDQQGSILAGYERCKLMDCEMELEERNEIASVVAAFTRKLQAMTRNDREQRARNLQGQATISVKELLDCKVGKCLLSVPPEAFEVVEDNGIEGKTKVAFRAGGQLLVESDSNRIVPIEGVGGLGFFRTVEALLRMKVYLTLKEVTRPHQPGLGQTFDKVVRAIMVDTGLSRDDAKEYLRKLQAFWHLIRRAVKDLEQKQAILSLKEEFGKRTSISSQDFYGLNEERIPKTGIALLEFDGNFKQKDGPSVPNPFLLVERLTDNGNKLIRIVDVASHARDLFPRCLEKTYVVKTEDFWEAGQLGQVLRAIRGQVDMAAENAKA